MRWKKRFSVIFLFLTLLHSALCNRQSHDKFTPKFDDDPETVIVPGPETAILQSGHIVHLDNMSFLDPYNLMASIKQGDHDEKILQNPLLKVVSDNRNRQKTKNKQNKNDSFSEMKEHKNSSKSALPVEETVNVTDSEQRSHISTETVPFGENDFDVYDDYSEFDGIDADFNDIGTRRGKKRKWNKRHEERNALLHEAVRNLLGFSQSHNANSKHRRLLPDPNREDKLPRYVKDLYERFQSGEMSAGLAKGNTVRSIHGSIGEIEGKAVFLFNLSSLRSSEQLLNAEIHLFKRRLRYKLQKLDIEVRLYQVAPRYISESGKIIMRDPSHGWQWYDVSTAVKNCLKPKHNNLFALSFRATKSNGRSRPVSLRKFGRHHSMPFLVLYSNETEAANFDQLDLLADRLWARNDHNLDQTIDGSTSTEESTMSNSRHGKSRKGNAYRATKLSEKGKNTVSHKNDVISSSTSTQSHINKLSSRDKRSIYNNEIPEGPAADFKRFPYHNKIPHTHPGILKTRKVARIGLDNRGFLPVFDRHLGMHRRRRKKHRIKKQRKGRSGFPKEWDNYVLRSNVGKKSVGDVCGRRKLTVDFADIGWGDWIISPKSFDAHYCSGSCPFPITKHLRPSNHATIQSIVHAIGIHRKVPAPCCVPDAMSSVTLLYFDEDRNVVLKNYPGMTVGSCACR